jgi:hypothetical protein
MRGMLKSLNDPYTRFLSPSEFASLSKYDITGVGLNIVDAPDSGSGIKVRARAYVSLMAWHVMICVHELMRIATAAAGAGYGDRLPSRAGWRANGRRAAGGGRKVGGRSIRLSSCHAHPGTGGRRGATRAWTSRRDGETAASAASSSHLRESRSGG